MRSPTFTGQKRLLLRFWFCRPAGTDLVSALLNRRSKVCLHNHDNPITVTNQIIAIAGSEIIETPGFEGFSPFVGTVRECAHI